MNSREGDLLPPPQRIDAWLQQAWEMRHEDTRAALALNAQACTAAWQECYVRGAVLGLLRVGLCHLILGDDDERTQAQLEQAARLMRGLQDNAGEAEAMNLLAHLHSRRSEHGAALEAYGRRLALHRQAGDRQGEAAALHNMALTLRDTQRLADAIELATASLEIAQEVRDEHLQAYVLHLIGSALAAAGDDHAAVDHFERCLALASRTRDRAFECSNRIALGEALASLGRSESALAQLQQALSLARLTGNRGDLAEALVALACATQSAAQAADQLAAARDLFDEALRVLAPLRDRRLQGRALCGLGHNERLHGDTAAALATLQQALAAAEASGADDVAARAHEALAGVHEECGDAATALLHWRRFHLFEQRLRGPGVQRRIRDVLTHAKLQPLRREAEHQRRRVRDLTAQLDGLRRPSAGVA